MINWILSKLKTFIGDYKSKAESYIDYYEDNKYKNKFLVKENPKITTGKITLNNAESDIRNLLNTLLLYTRQVIPEEESIDKLRSKELEIKLKMQKCDNIEILNDYYEELLDILTKKKEIREFEPNHSNLKAVRYLNQCGFIEAAYKWLKCFPNK